MSVNAFVDTNVLIYAASGAAAYPAKYGKAWGLISNASYAIFSQILAEFYVNVTKRTQHRMPLSGAEINIWLEKLSAVTIIPVDYTIVMLAVSYSQQFKISYWDAALIAASNHLNVPTLYTEDLNHGQKYGHVTVINPFKDL